MPLDGSTLTPIFDDPANALLPQSPSVTPPPVVPASPPAQPPAPAPVQAPIQASVQPPAAALTPIFDNPADAVPAQSAAPSLAQTVTPAPVAPAAPSLAQTVTPDTAVGSFARGAVSSAGGTVGGLAGFGTGAAIGAELGAFGGPLAWATVPAGALIGGIVGSFGGGWLGNKAQEKVVSLLPPEAQQAIGQSPEQLAASQEAHPYMFQTGALAPNLLAFSPAAAQHAAVEGASTITRLMANPVTARAVPAAIMAAQDAVQHVVEGQPIDAGSLALSAGAGALMQRPTRVGQALIEAGVRPVQAVTEAVHPPPGPLPATSTEDQTARAALSPAQDQPGPNQIILPQGPPQPPAAELPTVSGPATATLGPVQAPIVVTAPESFREPATPATEPPAAAVPAEPATLAPATVEPAPVAATPPAEPVAQVEPVAPARPAEPAPAAPVAEPAVRAPVPPVEPTVARAEPSTPPAETVTTPPDDGSTTAAGRPATSPPVGEAARRQVEPPGVPGAVEPGGDTQGRPPDDQGTRAAEPAVPEPAARPEVPPAAEPAAEAPAGAVGSTVAEPTAAPAPAAETTPTVHDANNPHPQSVAAQIDQLERVGQNRTSEQETQLQDLYRQRETADQASPEYTGKAQQLDQLNSQIATLETQVAKSEARKNNAITPSRALLAQRAQLENLRRQRDTAQSEMRTMGPSEAQRYNEAVYGPPAERGPVEGLTTEPDHVVPDQHVAKNADGEVVGKASTSEGALADAEFRGGQPYDQTITGRSELTPAEETAAPSVEAPGAPAEPAPERGPPSPEAVQLGKLIETRNALQAKDGRTFFEDQKLNRVNEQIKYLQGTVRDQLQQRRGGIKEPYRTPETGRPKDFLDYKFNNGVSVWRLVFEEAGHNPDTATQMPIQQQTRILGDHVKSKFGFKDVQVVGARGGGASPVEHFIARNALLDMTRAMTDMSSVLGLPYTDMSRNGTLKLVIVPEGKRDFYGRYTLQSGTIEVMGRANSFGHEWAHAWDHDLAQRLTGNPTRMNDLLSRYARGGLLRPNDPVDAAMAKIINTMFYDNPALAATRLGLEAKAQVVDRAGNPTKGAIEAQRQLDLLERGGSKLRIDASEFRRQSAAFEPKKAGYYASVYEMFARAHEAYTAWKMETAGMDPRGVVMPDEAYINETNRQLHMIYPKQEDRSAIFQAFDDLYRAQRNEQILAGTAKPPGEAANYGISDPHVYPVTAPKTSGSPLGKLLREDITRLKNFTRNLRTSTSLSDPNRPDPGYLTRGTRAMDYFRAVGVSSHGMMDVIIKRSPAAAKPIFTRIKDLLAAAPGEGRYTGEFFEEAARGRARSWSNRYANIMAASQLDPENITPKLDAMIRHVMVTGETSYQGEAIPQNIVTAAGRLRNLMDQLWQASHDAGLDVGYASKYYPRLYDMHRFFANPEGFRGQATQLYKLMFDREMGVPGADPAALLEKWTSLSKTDRDLAENPDLASQMQTLRQNLTRQREIEANPAPTAAERAELARLQAEVRQLAQDAHDPLGDHIAALNADNWHARMMKGGHADFDALGPSGKYLNARTLPPEADTIMKDYMHTNTADVIPNYINAVARRTAYAERFGPQGEILDEAWEALRKVPGIRGEDIRRFRSLVDTVTGRSDNHIGYMKDLQHITNVIHAIGSLALMPRAVWSSLAEPMNAALVTGDARAGFKIFASQFGQLFKTVSSGDRTKLANFLGVTTSAMHDSIMLSRMSADYADSPRLNRLMSQYYRVTGLTQVTNSQRIGAAHMSNWFLTKLAQDLQGGSVNAKDNATRWFRGLGLNDPVHADFAKFMTDLGGNAPSIDLLQKHDMGNAYGLAVRRLTDRVIQDPYKVDRATLSSVPVLGLVYQLMSFNYQFQRNVLNPLMGNIEHSYGRAKLAAEARGAGRLGATAQGLVAGGGSLVHAASIAASVIGVGFMTTALRQLLFAPDQWDKHEKDGDLVDYLTDLTVQRSGLNGVLDPIIQLFTNLRYDSEISTLFNGASINWMAKNAQDVIQPFVTANDSPNTNTRLFNQARGAFNLVGVPLAATGLTMLGGAGGPLTRLAAGAALQYGTSPGIASDFAGMLAGEKGTTLPKPGASGLTKLSGLQTGLNPLAKLGGEQAGEGAGGPGPGGLIPWGLMDDVAMPAWRVLGPTINALPGPVKIGALGLGGAIGAGEYLSQTAPFRNAPPPKPERKQTHP